MTLQDEIAYLRRMVQRYRFDSLTSCKLRLDFEQDTINLLMERSLYIVMFDVTGLHKVNREQGLLKGDALIKQVAYDIKNLEGIRDCYRIGGDEFIALFDTKPIVYDVENATSACIKIEYGSCVADILQEVDELLCNKKTLLKRRRDD